MTRSVSLLLLLLSSWLWSMPALGATSAPLHAVVIASADDVASSAGVADHVAAQSAMPQVPRAPLFARLPIPSAATAPGRSTRQLERPSLEVDDLRAALRRVQLRRRVPRLGGGDPPWS